MVRMPDADQRTLLYFEGASMRFLYELMDQWQRETGRRLLSVSVQPDGDTFCAIALTSPAEVVITSAKGEKHAIVSENGRLFVYPSEYS